MKLITELNRQYILSIHLNWSTVSTHQQFWLEIEFIEVEVLKTVKSLGANKVPRYN